MTTPALRAPPPSQGGEFPLLRREGWWARSANRGGQFRYDVSRV